MSITASVYSHGWQSERFKRFWGQKKKLISQSCAVAMVTNAEDATWRVAWVEARDQKVAEILHSFPGPACLAVIAGSRAAACRWSLPARQDKVTELSLDQQNNTRQGHWTVSWPAGQHKTRSMNCFLTQCTSMILTSRMTQDKVTELSYNPVHVNDLDQQDNARQGHSTVL